MDAKVIETAATEPAEDDVKSFLWSVSAIGSFGLSGLCFIAGLIASAASLLGIIPVSPASARWTVAILLSAFVFAFLGAHSIDKINEMNRKRPGN